MSDDSKNEYKPINSHLAFKYDAAVGIDKGIKLAIKRARVLYSNVHIPLSDENSILKGKNELPKYQLTLILDPGDPEDAELMDGLLQLENMLLELKNWSRDSKTYTILKPISDSLKARVKRDKHDSMIVVARSVDAGKPINQKKRFAKGFYVSDDNVPDGEKIISGSRVDIFAKILLHSGIYGKSFILQATSVGLVSHDESLLRPNFDEQEEIEDYNNYEIGQLFKGGAQGGLRAINGLKGFPVSDNSRENVKEVRLELAVDDGQLSDVETDNVS